MLFIASAAAQIAVAAEWTLEVVPNSGLPLYGAPVQLLAAVLTTAAYLVGAVGIFRESGFTGTLRFGRTAMVVLAAEAPTMFLLTSLFALQSAPSMLERLLQVFVLVVSCVAAVVAGIQVVRAGILHGFARWAFLLLAVAKVGSVVFLGAPSTGLAESVFAAVPLEYGNAVAVFLLGLSLLLWGRFEALRYRASEIRRSW